MRGSRAARSTDLHPRGQTRKRKRAADAAPVSARAHAFLSRHHEKSEGEPLAQRADPVLICPASASRSSDSCTSATSGRSIMFDHLVGADEERGWDRDVDGAGSLHVDYELELRRLLNRQVSRLLTPQNAIGKGGEARIGSALVRAIARKTTRLAVLTPTEHRGQAQRLRELRDLHAMHHGDEVRARN